ncbi:aldehyde dehydrogenase [Pisolithus thermaeus]|nr:aldehyde dehydrogenase [Pisolithus croceorrhizus]KAI6164231.1 aldehyde dehydrogenase [Pisolithus thermaeus]
MSDILTYTPVEEIPKIRDDLRATFRTGVTRSLEWRKRQLYQLARMAQNEAEAVCDAMTRDFGKPRFEVIVAELSAVIRVALKSAEKLEEWARPELPDVPDSQKNWKPTIYKVPKGTALIISPWNFPVTLTLQPLVGAIAAGCCAVLKPSENVPHFSELLAKLVSQYLDTSAYRVVNGAVPEITKVLELQWDHIFYTGNGRVARIVTTAAAKHLTPCSLELGGKSPVVVDAAYDMELAAKRILWGKCNNAGQICVAPDYILVPRQKQDELVRGFEKAYRTFFPNGALDDADYGGIVNDFHFKRLSTMLDRSQGEKVGGAFEGRRDPARRRLEPVIVKGVDGNDSLLEEEIFGPLLPIVVVDSLDDAIDFINARPHPLVLYAFTEDPNVKERLINETQSGSIVFNDTFQHLAVAELPFSGIGESGYGYQFLRYTFEAFTHLRSSVDIPKSEESRLSLRYPPHKPEAYQVLGSALNIRIPE